MNQFNIIITEMIFVASPALGVALLDYLVFNLVQAICGGVKPFISKSKMPASDSYTIEEKPSKLIKGGIIQGYKRNGKLFHFGFKDDNI